VDVVEEDVPKAQRNPKPAAMTDEEKAQFKAADKPTRKRLDQQRKETVRRRGVLDRNGYVITRLHHRYDERSLPQDIEVQPAPSVEGGLGAPQGPGAALPGDVEPATENRLQIRFAAMHPSKKVIQCENPTRYRWGQAPPDYRGLRKTWTARDIAYKKRDKFVLADVIKSSVPALGVAAPPDPSTAPPAPAPAAKPDSGCALATRGVDAHASSTGRGFGWALLAVVLLPLRRRRASRDV
jgi:hypothetical protein